ncbi:hypothetical protein ABT354_12190 [Streptomyces sp. NPDC000594]|uniref:hypothetical protein n=1 Tax=Streptomyces sp. NPDC000594 TaxID=3154261 RepID=UPI0033255B29
MRWLPRSKAVENAVVARQMRGFFKGLPTGTRACPRQVAEAYGAHLFHRRRRRLVEEKRFAASRFHVGIGVGSEDFARLTKRAVLVSDTLLLSHNGKGAAHRISRLSRHDAWLPQTEEEERSLVLPMGSSTEEHLHMLCPDLDGLGDWLLRAEPLMRAGSAWYLPTYSVSEERDFHGPAGDPNDYPADHVYGSRPVVHSGVPRLLDFVATGRRVVAQSDTPAVTSRIVLPVIEDLELPFLEGIPLETFGAITVGEFDAYRAFRSRLRMEVAGIDTALGAEEVQRALTLIGLRIEDEVRGMRAQLNQVRRKRAVAVTGAVVGTVSASLVAVYGPALQPALAAVAGGAAGGLWGAFQAGADNSPRALRENAWYYVWTLSRAASVA